MRDALRGLTALCALWTSLGFVAGTRGDAGVTAPMEASSDALEMIAAYRVTLDGEPRVVDVPVDSSVSELSISVGSSPDVTATLLRPGGARVGDTDRGVRVSDLETVDPVREVPARLRLYTVAAPRPGVWQVVLSGPRGAGAIHVNALGGSPISFDTFEFVRKQEGVHGGYFGIDGMPLTGPAVARARLSNGPEEATFRLVDETGRVLRTVSLRKGEPGTARDDFLGTFELPAGPFLVVMSAADASGAPIQRQYPVTFRAQPVAVFFNYGMSNVVAPASSRRLAFAVTNVGAEAEAFVVNVRASQGDVRDVVPSMVTVPPGTSATVSFTLALPAEADAIGSIGLRLAATSTANRSVGNWAAADVDIARPGDADNDFVADGQDNCREIPNHEQDDTNRDGIGDACDPSGGGPLTIRSLSPESGPPGTVVRITGTGFSPAGQGFLLFNGMPALPTAVTPTELTVTVPADAAAGPVSIIMLVARKGHAMSPLPFIVRRPKPQVF